MQNIRPQPSEHAPISALDELASSSHRLANVVSATSRRRDVRDVRANILTLLLRLAVPIAGTPRKAWYVAGGVARLGAEGIRRAWRGFYGGEPPSLRSMRSHLGELERGLALIRAPGDWMPVKRDPDHPEHRPRYPSTFLLLESDEDAEWWAREGLALLDRHPEVRANPDQWRRLFGRWRERAARLAREPLLPFEEPLPSHANVARPAPRVHGRAEPTEAAVTLARSISGAAAATDRGPLELLLRMRELGVDVRGLAVQRRLLVDPDRLFGAARLLARALARGDVVRNRAGWLVRAFQFAPELKADR